MAALVADGARPVKSPAEAAAEADIAITMLPDTPQVEDVIYGEGGLLASPPRGRLIVDMSTISPVAVRRMDADLEGADIHRRAGFGRPDRRQERDADDHGRRRGCRLR